MKSNSVSFDQPLDPVREVSPSYRVNEEFVLTNTSGRFEFRTVPPGRVNLQSRLRYRMAYEPDLLSRVMRIFSRVVFQTVFRAVSAVRSPSFNASVRGWKPL